MARITVEDCIDKFPSRFELVLIASNRARKLHSGETPTVEKDNDKNTVIALREIAEQTLTVDKLKNDLIEEYQTAVISVDDEIQENSDINENIEIENNSLNQNIIENTEEENQFISNEEDSSENLGTQENNPELSEDSE